MVSLPEPLPREPLGLVARWLDEAVALGLRNPHALAVATVAASGRPSLRFVLLKQLDVDAGYVVFYTNYGSRKAGEMASNERVAAAMYWEALGRQLRFEGRVVRSPAAESDAYFASRPRGSQLNAWASAQSRPCASGELERRLDDVNRRFEGTTTVPRPPFWGGYRLWLTAVELWCEGRDRFHERARFERELAASGDAFEAGDWTSLRLQP